MDLNDPFGRMGPKRERHYESLRSSLISTGLTDKAEAEVLLTKLQKRGRIGIAISVVSMLFLLLLFPEARVLFIALGCVLVMWFVNASRNGQLYVQRYIDEELSGVDKSTPDV